MVIDWFFEFGNFRLEDYVRDNKDIIIGNNVNGFCFCCLFCINRFEGWLFLY